MPYKVFAEGDKHCVRKLTGDGSPGELVACHEERSDAMDQVSALYASENNKGRQAMFYRNKATGQLMWIGSYTNNSIDDDRPPEIISKSSIIRFVEKVNKGEYPLPELWIWHLPELMVGKALWVSYHEKDGIVFGIAGGYVNKEAEPLVLSLIEAGWNAMSHGMPRRNLRYSERGVIVEHQTEEITLLPRHSAANKYTIFSVSTKEIKMDDKEYSRILDAGANEDALKSVLEANEVTATQIRKDGRRTKEQTEETGVTETDSGEATKEATPSEAVETPVADTTNADVLSIKGQLTELTDVTQAVVSRLTEQAAFNSQQVDLIKSLTDAVATLNREVVAMKSQQDDKLAKMRESLVSTPIASLASVLSETSSSVGRDETQVDGRTRLGKSAPQAPREDGGNGLFFQKWLS